MKTFYKQLFYCLILVLGTMQSKTASALCANASLTLNSISETAPGSNIWNVNLTFCADHGSVLTTLQTGNFRFTFVGSTAVSAFTSTITSANSSPATYAGATSGNAVTYTNASSWFHWLEGVGQNYCYPVSFTVVGAPSLITLYGMEAADDLTGASGCPLTVSTALPIDLKSFAGTKNKNGILLDWITASEKDNKEFQIERSQNGIQFEKIGTIAGKGTSQNSNVYNFLDRQPNIGMNFYRLLPINIDGKKEAFSSTINVMNDENSNSIKNLSTSPNPATDNVVVSLNFSPEKGAELQVVNALGSIVETVDMQANSNQFTINVSKFPAAFYYVQYKSKSQHLISKFAVGK